MKNEAILIGGGLLVLWWASRAIKSRQQAAGILQSKTQGYSGSVTIGSDGQGLILAGTVYQEALQPFPGYR